MGGPAGAGHLKTRRLRLGAGEAAGPRRRRFRVGRLGQGWQARVRGATAGLQLGSLRVGSRRAQSWRAGPATRGTGAGVTVAAEVGVDSAWAASRQARAARRAGRGTRGGGRGWEGPGVSTGRSWCSTPAAPHTPPSPPHPPQTAAPAAARRGSRRGKGEGERTREREERSGPLAGARRRLVRPRSDASRPGRCRRRSCARSGGAPCPLAAPPAVHSTATG